LVLLELDTTPTGTLVVLLPDPTDATLAEAYDELVGKLVVPDPQLVPDWSLTRSRAIDPRALLDARIWDAIREVRECGHEEAREVLSAVYAKAGLGAVQVSR
jgi:hypothetical protein